MKYAVIIMLVFSIGVALFFVGQHYFLPLNIDRDTELVISGGMAYPSVETLLVSSGVLKNPTIFRAFMILGRKDAEIRFGRYIVKKGMSAASLIELLTSDSGPIEDIEITIPEGFTISEIAERLEEYQIVETVEFLAAAVNNEEYSNFWMLDGLSLGESLEGYLFPDTYRVKPGNPETLVQSMLAAMQQQLKLLGIFQFELDSNRYKTVHEVLTLASIVEKESPRSDMNMIAGVFYNRFRKNWRFESDATINYILGTNKLIPNNSDIHVDNPYNSYLYPGLPPGPISNPGLLALQATLNPESHEYFFFLHTPDGETKLSKTFEEHLAYRSQYWE